MSNRVLLFVALLVALAPPIIDKAVSARGERYDALIKQHELFCLERPCPVDFDGDGQEGLLMIDRKTSPAAGYDSWLVVVDNGRELLRLPHWFMDGSYRTHVAIRNDPTGARLIIFDGTHAPPGSSAPPTRTVFAWNGTRLAEVPHTDSDHEILSALAARDDSGTFNDWVLYDFIRVPFLICYYILLAALASWLLYRRKNNPRSIIKNLA